MARRATVLVYLPNLLPAPPPLFSRRQPVSTLKVKVPVRPLIHQSTTPTPEKPEPAKSKPRSEATKTIMLALAMLGLLVGAALIAWNVGLFGEAAPPPAPERAASAPAIAPVPAAANSEDTGASAPNKPVGNDKPR